METQKVSSEHQETLSYCEGDQALKQVAQGGTAFWEIFKTHWNMDLGN